MQLFLAWLEMGFGGVKFRPWNHTSISNRIIRWEQKKRLHSSRRIWVFAHHKGEERWQRLRLRMDFWTWSFKGKCSSVSLLFCPLWLATLTRGPGNKSHWWRKCYRCVQTGIWINLHLKNSQPWSYSDTQVCGEADALQSQTLPGRFMEHPRAWFWPKT